MLKDLKKSKRLNLLGNLRYIDLYVKYIKKPQTRSGAAGRISS